MQLVCAHGKVRVEVDKCFTLETSARTVKFRAPDPVWAQGWVDALKSIVGSPPHSPPLSHCLTT